jgi:uncharacterized membrane protein
VFKLLLAIHLLFAIFAIGPLAHAATTAARGVRKSDPAATAASVRMLRVYSWASVLVVVAGAALMSVKRNGEKVGEFSDLWIWLSLVLWLVSVVLILTVAVPALTRVTRQLGEGAAVSTMTGRIAAIGGIVGVLFAAIVFLMVYRPGS